MQGRGCNYRHTGATITDEHCVILPIIIVDLVLLECSRQNFPCWIVQADLEALEIIRALLSRGSRRGTGTSGGGDVSAKGSRTKRRLLLL